MEHAGGVDVISEMVEMGADTMWRYLADRGELSASATLALNRLNREGPMRVTALAEAEGASQSAMTQLIQRLERQGLVERRGDPEDGRASVVVIGEAGRRLWDGRADVRRQRIADMLADVGPDDRVALWLAAQVVVRILGQMRQSAGLHMHADVTG
jgi:DNA-binding MarR family transcriptional regulator